MQTQSAAEKPQTIKQHRAAVSPLFVDSKSRRAKNSIARRLATATNFSVAAGNTSCALVLGGSGTLRHRCNFSSESTLRRSQLLISNHRLAVCCTWGWGGGGSTTLALKADASKAT